ncbi:MAG: metal ABC transporter permease [Candidatus Sericytochromatia bacterium]|nr:metal ABC transporter permease [Candidatus Sericytochromatia bacterium]
MALGALFSAWELFRDPILVAAIAGAVLGYLGVFVVMRRMVFSAAALAQAAGCGVATAFFLQIHAGLPESLASPRAWSLGATLLAIWILQWPGRRVISREGVLALLYMLGGAVALLLGTRISQEAHDIEAILFGSAVVVRPEDVALVTGVAGLSAFWLLWWHRGFWFASMDPDGARVRGLPVALLDTVLLLLLAGCISVATHALGALPVFAFSVLPALAVMALCRIPWLALALAASLGAAAGAGGYLLAYVGEFPVGASQTALAAAFVLAALAVRGLGRLLAWLRAWPAAAPSQELPNA